MPFLLAVVVLTLIQKKRKRKRIRKPSKKETNYASGFPSLLIENKNKNYEPYGKRSVKSNSDVSLDPPIRPSSSSTRYPEVSEVRNYKPYGNRNKTSKEYEPYK